MPPFRNPYTRNRHQFPCSVGPELQGLCVNHPLPLLPQRGRGAEKDAAPTLSCPGVLPHSTVGRGSRSPSSCTQSLSCRRHPNLRKGLSQRLPTWLWGEAPVSSQTTLVVSPGPSLSCTKPPRFTGVGVGKGLRLEVGPETITSVPFDKHYTVTLGWSEALVSYELVNKKGVRHFLSPNTSSMCHRDSFYCNIKETELCVSSADKTSLLVTLGKTFDSLRLRFLIYMM